MFQTLTSQGSLQYALERVLKPLYSSQDTDVEVLEGNNIKEGKEIQVDEGSSKTVFRMLGMMAKVSIALDADGRIGEGKNIMERETILVDKGSRTLTVQSSLQCALGRWIKFFVQMSKMGEFGKGKASGKGMGFGLKKVPPVVHDGLLYRLKEGEGIRG